MIDLRDSFIYAGQQFWNPTGSTKWNAGKPWSLQWDPDTDELRFEVRPGERASFDSADSKKKRSEIASRMTFGKDDILRWSYDLEFSTSAPLPIEWTNGDWGTIVGQVHQTTGAVNYSPPFGLFIFRKKDGSYSLQAVIRGIAKQGDPDKFVNLVLVKNFDLSRKHRISLVLKFDPAGGKQLIVVDGQIVLDAALAMGIADLDNYIQVGIYKADDPATQVATYSNMRVSIG